MKKIGLLVLSVLLMCVPCVAYAASANISVSASDTVMLGNNVTVTVKISSSNLIGSWQAIINYDKSFLQLVSSNTEGGGTGIAGVAANGTKSKNYTLTFKTLKKGSTKVSIGSYMAVDYNTMGQMTVSAGSKNINIKTKEEIEASYSTNAYLKSIAVGEYSLEPAFNKETKEYNVEVPNEVEAVNISATKEDGTATVSGTGDKDLVEGNNKFEIVVTAQRGNSLTYVVNVYRKELDPIIVNFNGKEYGIVRRADALGELPTFIPDVSKYGEDEIPVLKSDVTGTILVGLKDDEGKVIYAIYEDGKIKEEYIQVKSTQLIIYPINLNESKTFSNFIKRKITIDGKEVECYSMTEKSDTVIVYAQNIETGDLGYYSYNQKDNTVQLFDEELINVYNEKIQNYKYILIGCAVFIVLLLFIIVVRKPKAKKVNRDLTQVYKEEIVNDIEDHIEREIEEEIEKDDTMTHEALVENAKKLYDELNEEKSDEVKEIPMNQSRVYDIDLITDNKIDESKLSKKELKRLRKEEKKKIKQFGE